MESEKTIIARDYIKKFPNAKKKTLARIIYSEHHTMFNNVEHARSVIRVIKGSSGDRIRKHIKDKTLYSEEAKILAKVFDGFEDGEMFDYNPYQIPRNIRKVGYISDLHIPFHCIEPIKVALRYLKEHEIDCLVINGDLMDCYSLSRFDKNPTKMKMKGERDLTKDFLKRLRDMFPDILIIYKEGNHEERLEAYFKVKAPEFFDMEEFRLPSLLKLRELEIQWVNNKKIIQAGSLNVLHGHEFGQRVYSPVNPAKGYLNKSKRNIMCGHSHQSHNHWDSTLMSDPLRGITIGCLCDLTPEYMPINAWNHGFGEQIIDWGQKTFKFNNHRILRGKIE